MFVAELTLPFAIFGPRVARLAAAAGFVGFQLLLEGEPTVLALFSENPFPDHPPRYVRAVTWEYRFTAADDASGAWWRREWRGVYAPTLSRP